MWSAPQKTSQVPSPVFIVVQDLIRPAPSFRPRMEARSSDDLSLEIALQALSQFRGEGLYSCCQHHQTLLANTSFQMHVSRKQTCKYFQTRRALQEQPMHSSTVLCLTLACPVHMQSLLPRAPCCQAFFGEGQGRFSHTWLPTRGKIQTLNSEFNLPGRLLFCLLPRRSRCRFLSCRAISAGTATIGSAGALSIQLTSKTDDS